MHPRNRYNVKPDFGELALFHPPLQLYLIQRHKSASTHNPEHEDTALPEEGISPGTTEKRFPFTIDFSNPLALRELTLAVLAKDFGLDVILPADKLIPAVPQRLNYIHWVEDLLELCDSVETKGVPGNETETNCVDGNGTETSCVDGNGTETSCVDGNGTETNCGRGNGTETSCVPGNETETSCVDGNGMESSCVDGTGTETNCGGGNGTETKCVPGNGMETSCVDGTGTETNCVDGNGTETNCVDGTGTETSSAGENGMETTSDSHIIGIDIGECTFLCHANERCYLIH